MPSPRTMGTQPPYSGKLTHMNEDESRSMGYVMVAVAVAGIDDK